MRHGQLISISSYYRNNIYGFTSRRKVDDARLLYKEKNVNVGVLAELQLKINPYPTAFPYGNGMVLHFYQQQESSTTKTVHKVINKGLKTYV